MALLVTTEWHSCCKPAHDCTHTSTAGHKAHPASISPSGLTQWTLCPHATMHGVDFVIQAFMQMQTLLIKLEPSKQAYLRCQCSGSMQHYGQTPFHSDRGRFTGITHPQLHHCSRYLVHSGSARLSLPASVRPRLLQPQHTLHCLQLLRQVVQLAGLSLVPGHAHLLTQPLCVLGQRRGWQHIRAHLIAIHSLL